MDRIENTAILLLRLCLLLRERVYRAVAHKRPWYIRTSRGRCIATVLHVTAQSKMTKLSLRLTKHHAVKTYRGVEL
jgi:hypothetical protein